jgi:ABC-2 type transport system ATP-binding protein
MLVASDRTQGVGMRLEAVGKRYGWRDPWVVRDVTIEVAAGRLVRVEGRNGSGKSTLLRIAAGALLPSAGGVTGRPRAGYVPERFPSGLAFSAREYLLHMSRIHRLSGPAGPAAVADWLERLGATEYAGAPMRTLSRGMCQKVAVAQALLCRPGLLVLDEAWTGLDQAARGVLDAAVRERLAERATVLFVDHDPARLADRVDERWQLAGATVGVVPGGGGDGLPAGQTPASAAVIIEVTGLEPGMLPQLDRLAGIVSIAPYGARREGPTGQPKAVRLTVLERDSDAVLRQVLTWDGAHVAAVRR